MDHVTALPHGCVLVLIGLLNSTLRRWAEAA